MLGLRKGMKVVLKKESRSIEVAGAISEWAAAGFIICLTLGALDSGTAPKLAVVAAGINAAIVTVAMLGLRRFVVRRRN